MSEVRDAELTGRLKAGRQGFFLEDAKGVRWALNIDCNARDFLGQRITVSGRKAANLIDVREYAVAIPIGGAASAP